MKKEKMTVRELRRALFELENQEAIVVLYHTETNKYEPVIGIKKLQTPNAYELETR